MSLATRCPACGTVFRVVQDQLRVSEGWVRCGRCEDVFNALEGLFDLEHDAPPAWASGELVEPEPPAPTTTAPTRPAPSPPPSRDAPGLAAGGAGNSASAPSADVSARSDIGPPADITAGPQADPGGILKPAPAVAPEAVPGGDLTPRAGADPASAVRADASQAATPIATRGVVAPTDDDRADDEHAPTQVMPIEDDPDRFSEPVVAAPLPEVQPLDVSSVSFLRRAAHTPRPRDPPRVRAVWLVAGMLLGALLAAQWAVRDRDAIAARWPAAQPMLAALCDATGCAMGAPRRIEQLTVDSSGLVRLDGPANVYRLSLVLRNHDRVGVALPQVELTLSDGQGEPSARRVLHARELGARQDTIAAGGELALQALLDGTDARWSGYSLELFYP